MGGVVRTVSEPFPPPRDMGLPQKFRSWRRNQQEAVEEFLDAEEHFVAQCMPTGSGKSLTYVADAVLSGKRTVILTSTKALQSQLMGDFAEIGMVEIKGKNSYPCRMDPYGRGCDYGDCNFGQECEFQNEGCAYYEALGKAISSRLVVTNYAYWLTMNRFAKSWINTDLLVMDEAHHAENHLANLMTFHIRRKESQNLINIDTPDTTGTLAAWAKYASAEADRIYADEEFQLRQNHVGDKDFLKRIKTFKDKVGVLAKHHADHNWLIEIQDGIKMCPIWPKKYAKDMLFKNTEQVLMTSATVRPKTVEMLGLMPVMGKGDHMSKAEVLKSQVEGAGKTEAPCRFSDYPSIFDPANRLVIHIPTIHLTHRSRPEDLDRWVKRIDQIIAPRLHQKGIIHTVSYDRRNLVMDRSEYAEHMMTHTTESVVSAVGRFKAASPPAILVSPSVMTGFDFPYDQCRWQIIGKVPFPDSRDRLTKARMDIDPEYGAYLAMQSLVQASGRGTRAPNDSCVSFLIDDSAFWFMKKFARFAPKWFMDGYRTSDLIPTPEVD